MYPLPFKFMFFKALGVSTKSAIEILRCSEIEPVATAAAITARIPGRLAITADIQSGSQAD